MATTEDKLINLGRLKHYHEKLKTAVPFLDSASKIPTKYLPSYVSDVFEFTNLASFPTIGEANKIYVDLSTNKTYRWGGTTYIEISASLALGKTSGTAYEGSEGSKLEQDLGNLEQAVSVVQSAVSDINNTITSIKGYEFLYAKDTTKPVFNTAATSGSINFPTVEFNGPGVDSVQVTIPTFTNSTAGLVEAPQHTDGEDVELLTYNGWRSLGFDFNSSTRDFRLYAGDLHNTVAYHFFPISSASEFGFIKTGYTTADKNYAVQVNSSGDAYVNVPWTDTDTDTKVTQNVLSSTTAYFPLLVSNTGLAGDTYAPTAETNGVNKIPDVWYSAYSHSIKIKGSNGVFSELSPTELVVGEGGNYVSIQNGGIISSIGSSTKVFASNGTLMEIEIVTDAEIDALFADDGPSIMPPAGDFKE